jgi:glycosyltransferase involved in cell wall biosynthesis
MKAAYVCTDPGVPAFGRKGASVHMREVLRAMVRAGVEVTLVTRRIDAPPPPELAQVHVINLGIPRGADRERALLESAPEVRDALDACGRLDVIYERHALWSAAAMEYARDNNITGLLEVNAPLVQEQAAYREITHSALALDAVRRSFRSASAVIAVSDEVGHYISDTEPACAGVHVIPNGVDTDRFNPTVPAAFPPPTLETTTVGFVGTLKPWHGVDTLIRAIHAACTDGSRRLLIVGDGPERQALEQLARSLGVNAVFTGAVDPTTIPALLTSMDICVAPYPDLNGFYFSPLKLYEYMAAGRAIVAANIGQVAKVIQHEAEGLLYPAGDVSALAASLRRLHDCRDLRQRLGIAARQSAVQHHTWDRVVSHILSLAEKPVRARHAWLAHSSGEGV